MADRTIKVITDRLDEVTATVVSSLGVNVTAELIEETPVDTGWARANWVPTIGTPDVFNADLEGFEPGPGLVSSRASVQSSAVGVVATTYKHPSQGPIFVSNNVPYILSLNDGSSDQAPSGFVQNSIVRAIKSLDSRRFE